VVHVAVDPNRPTILQKCYGWLVVRASELAQRFRLDPADVMSELTILVLSNAAGYNSTWSPTTFADLQVRSWVNRRERRLRARAGVSETTVTARTSELDPFTTVSGREPDPSVLAEKDDDQRSAERAVRTLLRSLPRQDADLIRKRFGIGCRPRTQLELSAPLDITRAAVGQRVTRVLERLRETLSAVHPPEGLPCPTSAT
jgi:DNA-directed RNA polymerase specialized sigma24 family protein